MSGNRISGGRCVTAMTAGLLPFAAIAQDTATVYVQGVAERPVPMLGDWLLIALAVCLVLTAVFKLRHRGLLTLAIIGAAIALAVVNSPRLTAASGLDIGPSSPACNMRATSFTFDPYTAQDLRNQCERTPVRISGYDLPCTAPVSGATPGTVLGPGETLALQQCSGEPENQPPTFALSTTDYTIAEDAGPQSLDDWLSALSPGPANEADQDVGVQLDSDNPDLFSSAPALSGNNLTFTPAEDAFGEARITLTATDSEGASSTQTLLLSITPVNDPPTFSIPSSIEAVEDDPAANIPNWASNLSVGPANEASSQTLNFTVTNNNPSLFATQPDLSADGTLSYTLAPDQNGSATLTINADDGAGGTAGPATSTMSVAAVNDPPRFPYPDISRTVSGFEDSIIVIYLVAEDVEEDDYTFAVSGDDKGTGGQFYFPKDTLNVADRIAASSFDTFGVDGEDILDQLFTPVPIAPHVYTEFGGTTARFGSGFVFAYAPPPETIGSADLSIVFKDVEGGISTPMAMTLIVRSINDAPLISRGGEAVTGDTKTLISFNNELIGDPYVEDPIAIELPASLDRTDFKPLGTTVTDMDFDGFETEDMQISVSTALPASGGNGVGDYGDCAVSMTKIGGGRVLVFGDEPYSSSHTYNEVRQMMQTLEVNCRAAATGRITVDINDNGIRGVCPPNHPENYAREEFIDIVDGRCTRSSRVEFDMTFSAD